MFRFNNNGTVDYIYDNDNNWRISVGNWAVTADTYTASQDSNIVTSGIINEYYRAPEFIVKEYSGDLYLFAQWKSGDYTIMATMPHYYVFKKVNE